MLQDVYKSESDTNQRNQAIGALMFAYGYIKTNRQQAVDLYTRQCSIGVNAKDLATMAATLATGGKNPVTGKQVMDATKVPGVLAVMATAGLYDDSGKWLYHTGLPGQERRRRRHHRRVARQVRHRRGLAAARRRGQQRARAEGDRRHLERARRQPLRRCGEMRNRTVAALIMYSDRAQLLCVRGQLLTNRVDLHLALVRLLKGESP